MALHSIGMPEWNGHIQQPAPERELHQQENTGRHEVGESIMRQLPAWIDHHLFEFRQSLPDKSHRSGDLGREQQQIEFYLGALAAWRHRADDVASTRRNQILPDGPPGGSQQKTRPA